QSDLKVDRGMFGSPTASRTSRIAYGVHHEFSGPSRVDRRLMFSKTEVPSKKHCVETSLWWVAPMFSVPFANSRLSTLIFGLLARPILGSAHYLSSAHRPLGILRATRPSFSAP